MAEAHREEPRLRRADYERMVEAGAFPHGFAPELSLAVADLLPAL